MSTSSWFTLIKYFVVHSRRWGLWVGASNGGRAEGDPGSERETRQNQQVDGKLPAEGIQDAGRLLWCVWGEFILSNKNNLLWCYTCMNSQQTDPEPRTQVAVWNGNQVLSKSTIWLNIKCSKYSYKCCASITRLSWRWSRATAFASRVDLCAAHFASRPVC